jgi:putative ABC transport system permease protein
MRPSDILRFARDAASAYPLRTALSLLAMSIGVAAVVVLTALGDGARRYVVSQFSALGSNLVIVLPGRSATGGFAPGNAVTRTPRDLTVADAFALLRSAHVKRVAPLLVGTAEVDAAGRLRESVVAGTSSAYIHVRSLSLAQGSFLPEGDWERAEPVVVLGATVYRELFDSRVALGEFVRVGGRRVRVIGVLASTGTGMGLNTDELVFVPVALAQQMFNTASLFRVLIEAQSRDSLDATKRHAAQTIRVRHSGEEDVTVITQDAVLATFDRLLVALTAGVAGIAAISLAVAGILVMNVMLVAVTQRTSEIGLLKALGARGATIRRAFLTEAALLSLCGALLGYALGQGGAWLIRFLYPALPAYPPAWAVIAALSTSLITGIVFGWLPAQRAARMDPVQALMSH